MLTREQGATWKFVKLDATKARLGQGLLMSLREQPCVTKNNDRQFLLSWYAQPRTEWALSDLVKEQSDRIFKEGLNLEKMRC